MAGELKDQAKMLEHIRQQHIDSIGQQIADEIDKQILDEIIKEAKEEDARTKDLVEELRQL